MIETELKIENEKCKEVKIAENKSIEKDNKAIDNTESNNENNEKISQDDGSIFNILDEYYEILESIFNIMRNILFIADKNTLEALVADEFYLITFGALECNYLILI